MTDRPDIARRSPRRPAGRGGFSFAEVLFAVIILGVGFILVAAIFPVAIQQTQSTVEDAAAAAAARQAAGVISAVPTAVPNPQYLPFPTSAQLMTNPSVAVAQLTLFPPTVKAYVPPPATAIPTAGTVPPPAIVVPFTGPRLDAVRGNLVNATDGRFAYVPFYRRENGAPVAQLIVIAVTARNRPVFDPLNDVAMPNNYLGANVAVTYADAATRTTAQNGTAYTVYPDTLTYSGTIPIGEGCSVLAGTNNRSYQLGPALFTTSGTPKYALEAGNGVSVAPGPDGLWGTPDDVLDTAVNNGPAVPTGTLQPVGAYARIFPAAGSVGGRITLSTNLTYAVAAQSNVNGGTTDTQNVAPAAAVPGTFVIVADDYPYDPTTGPTAGTFVLPANTTTTVGAVNGRIYRLGQPVPVDTVNKPYVAPGTFELDPQYATVPQGTTVDVVPIPLNVSPKTNPRARVWLVGAGRTSALTTTDAAPAATLTTYGGPAQDIGVYTTLFPVQ